MMAKNAADADRDASSREGISRRSMLARTAALAGLAWTAPLLQTVPALAQGVAGTAAPCGNYYAVLLTRGRCQPLFPMQTGSSTIQDPQADGAADVCEELLDWALARL